MSWILALLLGFVEAPYYYTKDVTLRATCHRGTWSAAPYRYCCQPKPDESKCGVPLHE